MSDLLEGYTKVMLPMNRGDMSCLAERVWCKVLTGTDEAGTGIIDNAPAVVEWVKCGDRVTFETIFDGDPPHAPIVTAVIERQG